MFIRLTAGLCAGILAGMVILGTEQSGDLTIAAVETAVIKPDVSRTDLSAGTQLLANSPALFAGTQDAAPFPASLQTTPTGPIMLEAKETLALVTEAKDDGLIRISSLDAPARVSPEKGIEIVEVTGKLVNLRAGPSTKTDVLAKLRRGDRAELVADMGDGWMRIRDLNSGTEGYMSGGFLSPVTPG